MRRTSHDLAMEGLEMRETTARMALFAEWELYMLGIIEDGTASWRDIHAAHKRRGIVEQIDTLSLTGRRHQAGALRPTPMATWVHRQRVDDHIDIHNAQLVEAEQKAFAAMSTRPDAAHKALQVLRQQIEAKREREINREKRKMQTELVHRTKAKLRVLTQAVRPPTPKMDDLEKRMEEQRHDPDAQLESRKFLLLQRRTRLDRGVEELKEYEADPSRASPPLGFGRSPVVRSRATPALVPTLAPLQVGSRPRSPAPSESPGLSSSSWSTPNLNKCAGRQSAISIGPPGVPLDVPL